MRYLKNKLARARENVLRLSPSAEESNEFDKDSEFTDEKKEFDLSLEGDSSVDSPVVTTSKRKSRKTREPKTAAKQKPERGSTSAKNIVKNYGRALANFASSNLALPYLTVLYRNEESRIKDFRKFIAAKKKQARCIKGLRNLLIAQDDDTEAIASFKGVFKDLSVIFIKCFSVNWIFSGKLCDKITHLKYRFKILRRIRDPEHFTYLKGFS